MYDESKLLEVWKRELENQNLQVISQEELEEIENEFKRLRERKHKIGKSEIAKELFSAEEKIMSLILDDLLFIRTIKSFFESFSPPEALYGSADSSIISYSNELRKRYEEALLNFKSGNSKKTLFQAFSDSYELIILKKKVERFVDEWGHEHGPYNEGDFAFLPKKYAEILIKKEVAERVLG
ncbi:MAG: hypothetical protein QXS21_03240 [Thermoproteota archaeon]|nr:hypothetical protein [Candidatus Brockarchaeota archaeon]MBO3768195.1 hypothetical protein [Candidatus Brockarchaeota archaeon]MBO3800804.1 hypothetical protein [Candidatus Brockarchaeota archaeon]